MVLQEDSRGYRPIHLAAKSTCAKNLETFLKYHGNSQVNLKYKGMNCLHILIQELKENNKENVFDCLKLLVEAGCSTKMPDSKAKTPFYDLLTLEKEQKKFSDVIEFFLQQCEIDFHTYRGSEMINLMKQVQPEYKTASIPRKIDFKFMMNALNRREELDFEIHFKAFQDATNIEVFTDNCLNFMEVAASGGMTAVIDLLLAKGVDINARPRRPRYLKPPAFLACSNGYFVALEMFLKRPEIKFEHTNESEKLTLLHEICQNFKSQSKATVNVDFKKCFDLILKHKLCKVDAGDDVGFTPLHYTLRNKNNYGTVELLRKGAYINKQSDSGKAPVDEISAEIFENFLDECITKESGNKSENVEIDYSFLIAVNCTQIDTNQDNQRDRRFRKEIATLHRIANNDELKSLVSHPVLSSFLFLKWTRLTTLFYVNLAVCLSFLLSFVSFVVLSEVCCSKNDSQTVYIALKFVSLFSIILMMIRELFKLSLNHNFYFKKWSNLLEVLIILLALVVLSIDLDVGRKVCDKKNDSDDKSALKSLKASLILGVSFQFLQIIGSLPFLSVSTHMAIFKRVLMTFFKSFLLYSIIVVAFGFSFFVIFNEPVDKNSNDGENGSIPMNGNGPRDDFKFFRYPFVSVVRSFVMLTGELDASDIKLDSFGYLILVLFVFIVYIVLFNLLNALAVSDTQAIKEKGEMIDFIERIELLYGYESVIFKKPNQKFFVWLQSIISIYPSVIPHGKALFTESGKMETNGAERHTMQQFTLERNSKKSFVLQMSNTILKKVCKILANKVEKQLKQENENKFKEDIQAIKTQLNFQMKRNNDILTEQKMKIDEILSLLKKSDISNR